jgi:hypothetical protein
MTASDARRGGGPARAARWAWRSLLAAAAGFFVWRTFVAVDAGRVTRLLAGAGLAAPLALLPFLGVSLLDAAGWRILLGLHGGRQMSLRVLAATVGIEAMARSLPGGAAAADGMAPLVMHRAAGVTTEAAIAVVAARKVILAATQSVFLALALALAPAAAPLLSSSTPYRIAWPAVLGGAAALLAAGSIGAVILLPRAAPAGRLHRLLRAIPLRRLHPVLDRQADAFRSTDEALRRLFRERQGVLGAAALVYLGVWIAEAAEGLLFLWVLGVTATLPAMLFVEAAVSALRIVSAVVPGGIGPVDFGYAGLLAGLEIVPDADTAAAFILLHRLREALWTVAGFGILAWSEYGRDGGHAPAAAVGVPPPGPETVAGGAAVSPFGSR